MTKNWLVFQGEICTAHHSAAWIAFFRLKGNFGVNKQYLKWAFDFFHMDYIYVDWGLTKENPLPIIYVMKDNSYAVIMPCRINTEKGN